MGLRPSASGYKNEIGLGVSYGIKLDKDAYFWGYAPEYVRVFGEKWILNLSCAYDEETEFKTSSTSVTETWTPSIIIGYQLLPQLAVGGGFGHGIIKKEDDKDWESIKLGDDLSAALAFAVTLWSKDRHGIALSVSFEHNISDNEGSISTDLGYGFGF